MKKAQAAMEFLMTYGWAILAVLISIGALAYFGVLNVGKFTPESCIIAPGIGCQSVLGDDGLRLILTNGLALPITIDNIDSPKCGSDSPSLTLSAGGSSTFDVGCTLIQDDSFKDDIIITYTYQSISHTKIGSIAGEIGPSLGISSGPILGDGGSVLQYGAAVVLLTASASWNSGDYLCLSDISGVVHTTSNSGPGTFVTLISSLGSSCNMGCGTFQFYDQAGSIPTC